MLDKYANLPNGYGLDLDTHYVGHKKKFEKKISEGFFKILVILRMNAVSYYESALLNERIRHFNCICASHIFEYNSF